MAIKSFKEIIENKGYRISTQDREVFEQGNLQSFFGLGEQDAIEFVVYDVNDNQLPQTTGELVRYIPLNTQNIRDYILLPEGTVLQKYQFPKEYFIDVERLIKEAGYNNGIFKTQITLINKRVGSDAEFNKLYINEISPSRTEIRLLPLKKGLETNKELSERFNLMTRDGNFRDDTIYFVFKFIEKINPQSISTFITQKYSNKFLTRLKTEFKIQDFELFCTDIYNKFVESSVYEFTNRVSKIGNVNYGKQRGTKIPIELTVSQITETCRRIFIETLDYYLLKPNVVTKTTFDAGNDASFDMVGKILQTWNSDTKVDQSSPVVSLIKQSTLLNTSQTITIKDEETKTGGTPTANDDDLLPIKDPIVKQPLVLRNYLVQNFSDITDVVVRYKDAFGDNKQIKLVATDGINICALKDSVNIVETNVKIEIKDVGTCDKVGVKQGEKPPTNPTIISPGFSGGGAGIGGGGDTRLIEEPSIQNFL
jgi:hypothetical protein